MIETAQHSIDMQYFLLKPDLAGALVAVALLEAADRGVRVRFLLDDALTTAKDRQIARLDAHPNIEFRMINPLSRQSPTFWNYLWEFQRVNRRMHNKSMVVDQSLCIVGGRNIADEYFRVDTSSEFADFDIFLAGPVAHEIGEQFDLYWNDGWSVPLEALRPSRSKPLDYRAVEQEIRARRAEALTGLHQRAIESTYLSDVRSGRVKPIFAPIEVSYDKPEKLKVPVQEGERHVANDLLSAMSRATSEIILVSPYFVPEDWGARFFRDLAARGVRVRIVTNSLASNNHPYVHAGLMRHRKDLLAAGVELYEIKADALTVTGEAPPGSEITMTMHTKLAVIDSQNLFVGSLNFDPRSIKINTEIGIFIADEKAGGAMHDALDAVMHEYAYRLALDENGNLTWIYTGADRQDVEYREPGASPWRLFVANFTRLLPVEGQL